MTATWGATTVLRVYFRLTGALPSTAFSEVNLFSIVGHADFNSLYVSYHMSSGCLILGPNVGGSIVGTTVLAVDTWYRLDLIWNYAVSGSYGFYINGVLQGSGISSITGDGTPPTQLRWGWQGTDVVATIDFDDLRIDDDAATFPLGAGYGGILTASTLTLASSPAVFVKDSGTTPIDTGDWLRLDDIPMSEGASFVRQTTGSSTQPGGSVTLGFSHTNTDTINAVTAVASYGAAGSAGNNSRQWVTANGVSTYIHGSASAQPTIGAAGPLYSRVPVSNGGVAWTDAMLDAATLRFGSGGGTDVNPVPRYNNFILEVDYSAPSGKAGPPPHWATRYKHLLGR